MSSDPHVVDNEAASRFEVTRDGDVAELTYRRRGDRLVLIHTGVPEALEGSGVGSALVSAAVDTAERDGLTIVPECPFAREWLSRHPDSADRVRIHWPGRRR